MSRAEVLPAIFRETNWVELNLLIILAMEPESDVLSFSFILFRSFSYSSTLDCLRIGGGETDRRSPEAAEARTGSTVAVTAANLLLGFVLLLPINSSNSLPLGADLERFFFSVHFLTSSSTIWIGGY